MNKVLLNVIHLNSVPLNLIGTVRKGGSGGGGSGSDAYITLPSDIVEMDYYGSSVSVFVDTNTTWTIK